MLAGLSLAESAVVLRSLLDRHPELVAEVTNIARGTVTDVDAEAVAEEMERAVFDVDLDDLSSRAGRHSLGYVESSEAAWELLGEAVDPFLAEMERRIEFGFEAAATAMCAGIVLGLYRCRGKSSGLVLSWAEDFPAETAGRAVATLANESAVKRRRAWRLPDDIVDQVPEWAKMIGRCSKPASRKPPTIRSGPSPAGPRSIVNPCSSPCAVFSYYSLQPSRS